MVINRQDQRLLGVTNLADSEGLPRMMNTEVLSRIGSQDFQTELGQFNLEVNIVPHRLSGPASLGGLLTA